MSDSVRSQRRQPTRLPRPWDSPGKNTGVGFHFLLQCVKVKSLSRVRLLATPWTAAYQASPPVGFSKQEYWNGVPLPSPRKTKIILEETYKTNISKPASYILIEESMDLQSPRNAKPTPKEFYICGEKKRTSFAPNLDCFYCSWHTFNPDINLINN